MNLDGALTRWRTAVGEQHVVTDAAALDAAGRATFATEQQVLAVVRPGSREQVQACLAIATGEGVPVHVVSTGLNWGYGSRVPVKTGSVLIELRRLRAIRAYDEQLAYVTIEPGVTFEQLHAFLAERGSRLGVPFTGSSPRASVIGNTLERGLGVGRLGYRAEAVCGLEVVLPSGECVHTDAARFPHSSIAPVYRGGPGPALDGLFFQSNLGIVTALTLWLAPIPQHSSLGYFAVQEQHGVGPLVDGLRELLLRGIVSPVLRIRNDYNLLLTSGQSYPWEAMQGRTPLPPELLARGHALVGRRQWWSASWAAFVQIAGESSEHSEALHRLLREALADRVDRFVLLTHGEPQVIRWENDEAPAAVARSFVGFEARSLLESPVASDMAAAYWRKRMPVPEDPDPDRDGCGVMFVTPLVPLTGSAVTDCARLLRDTMLEDDFEPFINVLVVQARAAYLLAMIAYDREIAGEDERARGCHDRLLRATTDAGWIPHRLATPAASSIPVQEPDLPMILKRALDPGDILSPGRYVPEAGG